MNFIVQNSWTYLDQPSEQVVNLLDKELRYRPDGYQFSLLFKRKRWDGYNKCFDRKNLRFQTGLLNQVIDILTKCQIQYQVQDLRDLPSKRIPISKKTDLPPLRDYQKQAVEVFIREGRGIINIATGLGKTVLAIEIIARMRLSTLFVCPNTVIMHQVADILTKTFGKTYVGVLYGKKKQKNKGITVACVSSLPKLPKEFFDRFDLLIIDEFHRSAAATYQDLNKLKFNNIYHRLGLTATLMRTDGSEMDMEAVLSDVIFKMDAYEGIKKGYLAEPHFFLMKYKHNTEQQYKQWQKIYKSCIVENETRNALIIKAAKSLQKKNLNILILVKEIEHGNYLNKRIPNSVFIHGNTEHREELIEMFRNEEIKTVIGTSIFSEGSDVPCIGAIIMGQGMKAESDSIQKIGRALRLYKDKKKAIIIDIYDQGNKTLENQAKQRLLTYQTHYKNNIKIV